MSAVLDFFKPTLIKSFFLVEWTLFIFISIFSGRIASGRQLQTAFYPLLLFFLIACLLTRASRHRLIWFRGWLLYVFLAGSILLDQVNKWIVSATIDVDASIPLLENWLHISNVHNEHGSWILSFFDIGLEIAHPFTHFSVAIVFILGLFLFHRFYVAIQRKSIWVDVAFLGIFSGYAGFLWDMTVRGYVLDYISLPEIVVADLKDIMLAVGLAAFFAEITDNPDLSWRDALRWRGWRQEWGSLVRFVKEFTNFTFHEIHALVQAFLRKLGATISTD